MTIRAARLGGDEGGDFGLEAGASLQSAFGSFLEAGASLPSAFGSFLEAPHPMGCDRDTYRDPFTPNNAP